MRRRVQPLPGRVGNNGNVSIRHHSGGDRPHDLPFIKNIDVLIDYHHHGRTGMTGGNSIRPRSREGLPGRRDPVRDLAQNFALYTLC